MSVAILQLHREHDVFCLLDPVDYAWAKQWLWNCGYFFDNKHRLYPKRNIGPDRASVYLHREIMQRAEPRRCNTCAATSSTTSIAACSIAGG